MQYSASIYTVVLVNIVKHKREKRPSTLLLAYKCKLQSYKVVNMCCDVVTVILKSSKCYQTDVK